MEGGNAYGYFFCYSFYLHKNIRKRTLPKFNAFDFVVTVTLGSVLAYMMLGQVNLAEGAVVLFLIIMLQLLFANLSRSSETMEKLLNASPTLLFYQGKYLQNNMKKEQVTIEEIISAIRLQGIEDMGEVRAVIIEANGDMSIIRKSENPNMKSSLGNFQIPDKENS